jgi:hypothetical protein
VKGLAVAALLLAFSAGAQAQSVLRGTIVDSVTQRGIPGVVVSMLDARGDVVGRVLTNASGQYATIVNSAATRVRVVRIGWRPRERALPIFTDGQATANFSMPAIPTFLEPARVDAQQCPKRADADQAYGLWDQVRAGLLNMVVAREQSPGSMVLVNYSITHRDMDGEVLSLTLRRDSSGKSINSYHASLSADKFVTNGFATEASSPDRLFYGPDANVLLDGGFANGYCFRVQRPDGSRPTQVGLGFAAADRKPGRVDIEGTLWVDTAVKAIREIEYRYIGIHSTVDPERPGGSIRFREMPNGLTFIDSWRMRLIGSRPDTMVVGTGRGGVRIISELYTTIAGGELAHARWPDGSSYDADLAGAEFTLRTKAGAAALGRFVGLGQTPYEKQLDSTGTFVVRDLIPGPYALIAAEPRLKPLQMDSMPTRIGINAVRGQTARVSAVLPTLEEWTEDRCARQGRLAVTDTTLVLGRLLDRAGTPMRRASFKVEAARRASPTDTSLVTWETILDGGRSDADGLLQACTSKILPAIRRVRISGRLPNGEPYEFIVPLAQERLTVAPLVFPYVVRQ